MRCFAAHLIGFSKTSLINSIIKEHECKILIITILKSPLLAIFAPKRLDFAIRKRDVFMDANA